MKPTLVLVGGPVVQQVTYHAQNDLNWKAMMLKWGRSWQAAPKKDKVVQAHRRMQQSLQRKLHPQRTPTIRPTCEGRKRKTYRRTAVRRNAFVLLDVTNEETRKLLNLLGADALRMRQTEAREFRSALDY